MKVTSKDVTIKYQHGSIPWEVLVPKGTPVSLAGYKDAHGKDVYWAADLASFLKKGSIQMHDATYHGLIISADDVEEKS